MAAHSWAATATSASCSTVVPYSIMWRRGRHRVLGDQRRTVRGLVLHRAAGAHRRRRCPNATLDVGARGRPVRQQRDVDLAAPRWPRRRGAPSPPKTIRRRWWRRPMLAAGRGTRSPRPAAAAMPCAAETVDVIFGQAGVRDGPARGLGHQRHSRLVGNPPAVGQSRRPTIATRLAGIPNGYHIDNGVNE